MCLHVLLRLGIWTLLLVLIAGCGGSEQAEPVPTAAPTTTTELGEGQVLFQDDFSDPTRWYTGALEQGEASYAEGAYRIFTKQAGRSFRSDIGGPRVDALGLEVEATQVAGGSGDFVGVRCYTAQDASEGYQLGISPADRGYAVAAFRGEDFRLLESSREGVEAIRPPGEENQLRVECATSREGQTILTLAANGHELVRAEDDGGQRGFDAFGLFVETTEGGAEALFDDIVVTELVPR